MLGIMECGDNIGLWIIPMVYILQFGCKGWMGARSMPSEGRRSVEPPLFLSFGLWSVPILSITAQQVTVTESPKI